MRVDIAWRGLFQLECSYVYPEVIDLSRTGRISPVLRNVTKATANEISGSEDFETPLSRAKFAPESGIGNGMSEVAPQQPTLSSSLHHKPQHFRASTSPPQPAKIRGKPDHPHLKDTTWTSKSYSSTSSTESKQPAAKTSFCKVIRNSRATQPSESRRTTSQPTYCFTSPTMRHSCPIW
jgi:hypothetical protein